MFREVSYSCTIPYLPPLLLLLFLVTHNYTGAGVVTAVDEKDGAGRCVTAWNVESIEARDLGGATLPGLPVEGGTEGGRKERKEGYVRQKKEKKLRPDTTKDQIRKKYEAKRRMREKERCDSKK